MKRLLAATAAAVACLNTAHAQDASTLARIRDEGMHRSQVLALFNHLTNVIGPRLTGSPAFKESIDWSAAALVLRPSEGTEGTMFVLGNRTSTAENSVPSVIVAAEHYNLLVRALQAGSPVRIRANVQTRYYAADTNGYNVIAEIPGADPKIGREVVLLGAHIDSWHSATGASDNADAVAELMEAMRILKTLGIAPRRTIRAAIWGGEEEGLLGSRAYVAQHYTGDANAGAREKLSVYLNNDPGTGPIYGWYSEGNSAAKSLFDRWLAPLKVVGGRRNIIEKIGSTDHVAFTEVGLPGFNTIQDYSGYDTRMHHTNMDFYERVKPDELKQAAVVLASFAYQAAMRQERFPRASVLP